MGGIYVVLGSVVRTRRARRPWAVAVTQECRRGLHNLAGQPLLNVFVGLMMLVGLVVAVGRFGKPRYGLLVLAFGVGLLPGFITSTGSPDSWRVVVAAVPAFALAGVGINYILQRWYQTFPLNAPARLVGLWLMLALLALSAVQGWRAYFVAWAQDPETYKAYNEAAVAEAGYLNANGANNDNFLVASQLQALPVEYLTHYKSNYKLLNHQALLDLPLGGASKKLFLVPADATAAENLGLINSKFPNATVHPQYSAFSGKLLFYTDEVNPQ